MLWTTCVASFTPAPLAANTAHIGPVRDGMASLNDYCSARGRAKFVADWVPGGPTLVRGWWGTGAGQQLGFYQLSPADINRITEESHGGQTVAMHGASEGLRALARSTAVLYAMRAKTGAPMTVASKSLSGAANFLLVVDAGIGFAKEAQEILNCQAGH